MNDIHENPDAEGSGVKTEALLPDGRKVQADIMHLREDDQIRWLVLKAGEGAGRSAPPCHVDLQYADRYEGEAQEP